jgi:hypothetical protein
MYTPTYRCLQTCAQTYTHTDAQIHIKQRLVNQAGTLVKNSKLSLVDLAGSERWGVAAAATASSVVCTIVCVGLYVCRHVHMQVCILKY